MSETLDIANTLIDTSEKGNSLFTIENEGQTCISSGKLLPYVQAKVILLGKNCAMERNFGHILDHGRGNSNCAWSHLTRRNLRPLSIYHEGLSFDEL